MANAGSKTPKPNKQPKQNNSTPSNKKNTGKDNTPNKTDKASNSSKQTHNFNKMPNAPSSSNDANKQTADATKNAVKNIGKAVKAGVTAAATGGASLGAEGAKKGAEGAKKAKEKAQKDTTEKKHKKLKIVICALSTFFTILFAFVYALTIIFTEIPAMIWKSAMEPYKSWAYHETCKDIDEGLKTAAYIQAGKLKDELGYCVPCKWKVPGVTRVAFAYPVYKYFEFNTQVESNGQKYYTSQEIDLFTEQVTEYVNIAYAEGDFDTVIIDFAITGAVFSQEQVGNVYRFVIHGANSSEDFNFTYAQVINGYILSLEKGMTTIATAAAKGVKAVSEGDWEKAFDYGYYTDDNYDIHKDEYELKKGDVVDSDDDANGALRELFDLGTETLAISSLGRLGLRTYIALSPNTAKLFSYTRSVGLNIDNDKEIDIGSDKFKKHIDDAEVSSLSKKLTEQNKSANEDYDQDSHAYFFHVYLHGENNDSDTLLKQWFNISDDEYDRYKARNQLSDSFVQLLYKSVEFQGKKDVKKRVNFNPMETFLFGEPLKISTSLPYFSFANNKLAVNNLDLDIELDPFNWFFGPLIGPYGDQLLMYNGPIDQLPGLTLNTRLETFNALANGFVDEAIHYAEDFCEWVVETEKDVWDKVVELWDNTFGSIVCY